MDTITIRDLEVMFHVGVTDAERSVAQRLCISIELHLDFTPAAAGDDLSKTIDYFTLSRQVLQFGDTRSWKLIEKLAVDLASFIRTTHRPKEVSVEVKKFIIPEARFVSVRVAR